MQNANFQVTTDDMIMYSGFDGDLACTVFLHEAQRPGQIVILKINDVPVVYSYEPARPDAQPMTLVS